MVTLSQAVECPVPGEKCKVLFLSAEEENLFIGKNGILDTAAQARAIDLGGIVVYLRQKLQAAPAGDVKEVPPAPKADAGGNTTTQPLNGTNTGQKNVDDKK